MNLKKIGNVLTSKSVGTGPSSYEKRIYRAAVSHRLRNTYPCIDGTIIVKVTLKKMHLISCIAFIWLMIRISGGLL